MKKYVTLILMLLLCFMLLGCEKPEEPVGDTPVNDTQAPETVTPNEVVTPSEVEPEVVTPNEPEVPIEPEVPTEPEQPEENVIMLPEADENTKYITIDFPEVFPEEPYTEPNLVSPEEFDWGEYVPLVTYGVDTVPEIAYTAFVIHPAILCKEAESLSSARNLYVDRYESYLGEYLYDQSYKSSCFRGEDQDLIEKVGLYYTVVDYNAFYVDGIKYQIKINENLFDGVHFSLADSCNDKLWLIEAFHDFKFATYMYNTETKESTFLGNYLFGASLSPDGKYLAYCSPLGELMDIRSADVYTLEKQGFYVKNLETEETVFYSCDNVCYKHLDFRGSHHIRAWVKA